MMDLSPETVGLGIFGALLIIKEVRHWTTPILMGRKNGGKLGERVAANETDIGNIKEGFVEFKKDNRQQHDEIKTLIINGGK